MAKEVYPFGEYMKEDLSRYPLAREKGYIDPYDMFRIGDSGGFLMNFRKGRFVNTHLFCEMANIFQKEGKYTNFKKDSIPYRQLRKRETHRRYYGYSAPCWENPDGTIEDIYIPGDYYNFLNYTRMSLTDENSIQGNGKGAVGQKKYGFPRFIDAQFWTSQCLNFAKNNGFHVIIVKTRRAGMSYYMAARSANAINLQKHKVFINVASDKKYLTKKGGLTDFAINSLKFYEEKTMFKRGIFSPNVEDFRLGFRLPNGVESEDSWQSSLISVSAANDPDCAIGKDAIGVNVEELSTMDNFDDFMFVTEPAMTVGDITTGMLVAWGTATATNMQVFESNFYNPKGYNFMPFENVWDKDCRHEVCGFFKSYAWGIEGEIDGVKGVDEFGNSRIDIGLQLADRGRKNMKANAKTYADYINYCGQRALFPAEAFSSATENIFASEEFNKWEDKLRLDNNLKFYVDGQLFMQNGVVSFKSNERIKAEDPTAKIYDWINGVPRKGNEDPHGCVRVWFPPKYDIEYTEFGQRKVIPRGTYTVTYDPVGIDKEKKAITNKHSHNSIRVWENPSARNGYKFKCCAAYYGRPDKLEEADKIFYMLCVWYHCYGTGIVEVNRGETVSNMKKWKALQYLAHEPLFVWDSTIKGKFSTTYGYVVTDGAKKLDALRLLKETLYEVIGKTDNGEDIYAFTKIYDYQSILELKKWNAEGNFDRVSEMLLYAIYYKSLDIKGKLDMQTKKKVEDLDEKSKNDFWNREWFTD